MNEWSVASLHRVEHLGLNVVLQLLVGVPLEMVHGATRIGLVYVAGVVAGRREGPPLQEKTPQGGRESSWGQASPRFSGDPGPSSPKLLNTRLVLQANLPPSLERRAQDLEQAD